MSGETGGDREALGLLGIARRAGRAVIGAEAIRSAWARRPVFAIVVAGDAADNAVARLGELAEDAPLVRLATKKEIGRALGRDVVALVGVTDRELARRIVELGGSGRAGAGQDRNDARG